MGQAAFHGAPRAQSYRDIIAWQRAMDLVGEIYQATRGWPGDERFGLTNQIRRAAVSIPSNIAEGQGRFGSGEWLHHLSMAHGSLCEVETQLLVAGRVGYIEDQDLRQLLNQAEEVGRVLRAFTKSIRESASRLPVSAPSRP
jgi:four helix bundle protein